MYGMIGQVVGGVLMVWLLSWLADRIVWRRMMGSDKSVWIGSTVAVAAIGFVLYLFNNGFGYGLGPFSYLLAIPLVLTLRYALEAKSRRRDKDLDGYQS